MYRGGSQEEGEEEAAEAPQQAAKGKAEAASKELSKGVIEAEEAD